MGTRTPILLQTAWLQLFNPHSEGQRTVARAILDSGSQRMYITSRLRDKLGLRTVKTESFQIKTFGNATCDDTSCDIIEIHVHVGVETKGSGTLMMTALVVQFICDPLTTQPIDQFSEHHEHLLGLELADSANASEMLEVDMLTGSDWYWNLVTRRVARRENGPTAIHTKVGWVLSGPADQPEVTMNLTFVATHVLKIETCPSVEDNLDDHLRQFWELESLGVIADETSVYEKFGQQIKYDGQRYGVSLPWKEHHPPLPDHYDFCHKRVALQLRAPPIDE